MYRVLEAYDANTTKNEKWPTSVSAVQDKFSPLDANLQKRAHTHTKGRNTPHYKPQFSQFIHRAQFQKAVTSSATIGQPCIVVAENSTHEMLRCSQIFIAISRERVKQNNQNDEFSAIQKSRPHPLRILLT